MRPPDAPICPVTFVCALCHRDSVRIYRRGLCRSCHRKLADHGLPLPPDRRSAPPLATGAWLIGWLLALPEPLRVALAAALQRPEVPDGT